MEKITPAEIADNLSEYQRTCMMIDVRKASEFTEGHVPGAINIPMSEISQRMSEIRRDGDIICICLTGGRASVAAGILEKAGYKVRVMEGGMKAWKGMIER